VLVVRGVAAVRGGESVREPDRDLLDEGDVGDLSPDVGGEVSEGRERSEGPDLLLGQDHLAPFRCVLGERPGGGG
jgi:hypothetical protein